MDTEEGDHYVPGPEYQLVTKESLIDASILSGDDKKQELWLIQLPIHQDFLDGQEISLKLNHGGTIGSFQSQSGTSYELVSNEAQNPDATVFIASGSEAKAVGKITRGVSLIHYPNPEELSELVQAAKSKPPTSSLLRGSSTLLRGSKSSGKTKSSHQRSSRTKSIISAGFSGFETGETSKKKHTREPAMSVGQDSEPRFGHSGVSSVGSGDMIVGESPKRRHKSSRLMALSDQNSD